MPPFTSHSHRIHLQTLWAAVSTYVNTPTTSRQPHRYRRVQPAVATCHGCRWDSPVPSRPDSAPAPFSPRPTWRPHDRAGTSRQTSRSSHATQRRHEPPVTEDLYATLSPARRPAIYVLKPHGPPGRSSDTPAPSHFGGPRLLHPLPDTHGAVPTRHFSTRVAIAVRFSLATPKSALIPSTREHTTPHFPYFSP